MYESQWLHEVCPFTQRQRQRLRAQKSAKVKVMHAYESMRAASKNLVGGIEGLENKAGMEKRGSCSRKRGLAITQPRYYSAALGKFSPAAALPVGHR